ncbi:lytic transglycosylase [Paracoccus sp. CPCC 101403]|uniref:Lytic transglycosylase n=2 Tax=Paracoccus broussonetiae TaxID=3075834 RepID=A0ABU3EIJ4_9RHOB|nr:lytic transglycosylase [Paracoccus sp. CPCC 101403]MDT1064065.1 lytic transglycosylase [Paracoccus sp. CPCC 101403]
MKRAILAAAVLLSLGACASNVRQPDNTENACRLFAERRDFGRAVMASEQKWGIPAGVQLATIYHESSFRGNAKPPRKKPFLFIIPRGRISSAYGYSQALDGTWDEYRAGPGRGVARRDNIHDAADFIGWYMAGTSRSLGVSPDDAYNQYLAYHEGRGGYSRGSYRSKSWLKSTASRVERRSELYQLQLTACR